MKMIGVLVSVVTALIAHKLDAAAYSVVAENGDLAAPGTWTDSSLPGETDEVTITKWNSTYTLSKDMTFGSLYVDAGNVMFDFREGNPTLTLTTPIKPWGVETLFRYPERTSGSLWVKLCGGTWDCSGKCFDIVNLGFAGYYTFILTNGCHLSNVDRSYLFRRINNARIYVTDKSKITANKLNYGDGTLGTNDVIEVSDGSEIALAGSFVGQSKTNEFCSNLLVVKDENTKFSCNYLSIGPQGKGGFGVKVLDGAEATASDASMFYAGAENCLIEVRDGSAFNVGCFDWYGSKCHALVSNATLKIAYQRFSLGGMDNNGVIGHHNRLTLAGSETVFVNPMWHTDIFGGTSHDNVFEVTAGAKVSPGRSIKIATSTNNVMRLSGSGTEFSMAGLDASSSKHRLEFGWTNAVGNVLEILDGAKLAANGLRTYGKETQVVVSNGTLSVGGDWESDGYYGIWLGKGANVSGCSLVLKGKTPRIEAIAPYSEDAKVHPAILAGGTVLRYEIPEEGYAPGYIPVELYGLYPASARLEIECADWAAVKGQPMTELVLFRGKKNVGVDDFVASLDDLPENVTCFVRGNDIVLRRRGSRKLQVIIR